MPVEVYKLVEIIIGGVISITIVILNRGQKKQFVLSKEIKNIATNIADYNRVTVDLIRRLQYRVMVNSKDFGDEMERLQKDLNKHRNKLWKDGKFSIEAFVYDRSN